MTRKTAATAATLLDAPTGPLTPGVYVGVSGTPGYDFLMASTVAGATRLVGERFLPDGRKVITVLVGDARGARRQNPGLDLAPGEGERRRVTIGPDFFAKPLRDYRDWPQGWWREAVQNAVDAGARNIALRAVENADGTWTVSCDDDGSGMSPETLATKFLDMAGTSKTDPTSGTTGGFGEAKRLLLFPWISWKVYTRTSLAVGTADDYRIVHDRPARTGTLVEVVMPKDTHTHAGPALAFLGKCYLPGVKITVNGERASADLRASDLVEDFSLAQVYAPKIAGTGYTLIVRVNGIYMFERYLSSIPGRQVICEITAPSVQVLTSNRDGFRHERLARSVDDLITRLAADTRSALSRKKGHFTRVYEGDPALRYRSELKAARLIEQIGPINSGSRTITTEVIQTISAEVDAYREEAERESTTKTSGGGLPSGGTAKTILEAVAGAEQSTLEATAKNLVWRQPFIVINEVDDLATSRGAGKLKKFLPESMTPQIARLAKVWSELCRYALSRLSSFPDGGYGVGFIFSEDKAAAFLPGASVAQAPNLFGPKSGWLLLNPAKNFKHLTSGASIEVWSPTKDADLKWLFAAVVHECTHVVDNCAYKEHNEDFAAALTYNIARLADGFRHARQIVADNKLKDVEGVRQKRKRAPSPAERQAAVDLMSQGYSTEEEADLFRTSVDVTVSSYDRAAAKEKLYQTISSRVRRAAGFVPTVAEVEEIKRGWSTAGLWG